MEYLDKMVLNINDLPPEHLFAKEGDIRSRGIYLQILNNNEVIDTTGLKVELFAMHTSDTEPEKIEAEEQNTKEGKYIIYYSDKIIKADEIICEIRFSKDKDLAITTLPFKIRVGGKLWT